MTASDNANKAAEEGKKSFLNGMDISEVALGLSRNFVSETKEVFLIPVEYAVISVERFYNHMSSLSVKWWMMLWMLIIFGFIGLSSSLLIHDFMDVAEYTRQESQVIFEIAEQNLKFVSADNQAFENVEIFGNIQLSHLNSLTREFMLEVELYELHDTAGGYTTVHNLRRATLLCSMENGC